MPVSRVLLPVHDPARPVRAPRTRRPWPFLALAFLGLALGLSGVYVQASHAATPCYEDEPCFVWSKGGDGQRGVTLHTAPATCAGDATAGYEGPTCTTVVSARRFCRLDRAHRVDWDRTAHLRGDRYARTLCKRHR
jgi:hypothetical protein